MRVHYIQRCGFKTRDLTKATGWDAIVRHDYMGSAEFDFGLGTALRTLVPARSALDEHVTKHMSHDGLPLIVLAPANLMSDALATLDNIIAGKHRLKGRAHLAERLRGEDGYLGVDLWWDIENAWIAVLGEDGPPIIRKALDAVATKWGLP